jgi:hypothetical protein
VNTRYERGISSPLIAIVIHGNAQQFENRAAYALPLFFSQLARAGLES